MQNKPVSEAVFIFNHTPVSVNEAIRMSRRGGYKTYKYEDWIYQSKRHTRIQIDESDFYQIEIYLGFSLYTKKGSIRVKDTFSYTKYLIDVVFGSQVIKRTKLKPLIYNASGDIDDSRVLGASAVWKFDSEKDITVMKVKPCRADVVEKMLEMSN